MDASTFISIRLLTEAFEDLQVDFSFVYLASRHKWCRTTHWKITSFDDVGDWMSGTRIT